MPKRGGRRKKTRTHQEVAETDDVVTKVPRSFVFKRGNAPPFVRDLVQDMRDVMYPNTSLDLKESDKTRIKDYINVAGGYGVTHMLIFSSTDRANYFRVMKTPSGPTFTFKLIQYSTKGDISGSQLKPKTFSNQFAGAPMLIMNGFHSIPTMNKNFEDDEEEAPGVMDNSESKNLPTKEHYELLSIMLKSLFPPINPAKTQVSNLKRICLFNCDKNKDIIEFRHYRAKIVQTGINKKLKRIITGKGVPNLKNYEDIADYILGQNENVMSESEFEELPDSKIEVDHKVTKKKTKTQQASVRLYEVGPRMRLKLVKIEEGLLGGNVIFHRNVSKTREEVVQLKERIKEKAKLKEERKRHMQEVINKKMQEKLEKQQKKKERREAAKARGEAIDDEEEDEGSDDDVGTIWGKNTRAWGEDGRQEDEEEQE